MITPTWSTTVRAIETPRGPRYIGTCYESRGPDARGAIGPVPRGARVTYETRPLRSANDAREYARGRTIHHNVWRAES